jgi:hypothetical protein
MPDRPHLKVLFLAANPAGTATLRIGYEMRALRQRLSDNDLPVCIDFVHIGGTEPKLLLPAILGRRPDVVHISGHGEHDGSILLEGTDGDPVGLSADRLGELFQAINAPGTPHRVRCVLLNACNSGPTAKAISSSVDVAIGTAGPIHDDAAIAFAEGFYGGLAACCCVDQAVNLGRKQMGHVLLQKSPLKWPDHPSQFDSSSLSFTPWRAWT